MRLPTDLLRRSPQEASRLLALSYLDEIGRAERRLADPADPEALHDFRVGLRRLRSCLRAYRAAVKGSVSKKMRRQLRELTLETNVGRDTEVQLAWLRNQGPRLAAEETAGLGWLIGRLEGRKSEVLDQATPKIAQRFVKLDSRIRPELLTFQVDVTTEKRRDQPTFAELTAELIRQQTSELVEALNEVESRQNVAETHRTRILVKRLRYLLEPIAPRVPRVKGYLKRLKQAQNVLGELHDMQVMLEAIPANTAIPAIGGGLEAIRKLAEQGADLALADFQRHWTGAHAAGFLRRIVEVGKSLSSVAAGKPGDTRVSTSDAPDQLVGSLAGAPIPLSLTSTPLPLPLRSRQRLR